MEQRAREEKKTVCVYIGGSNVDGKVYSIKQAKEINPGIDLKPMDGKKPQRRYNLLPGNYALMLNGVLWGLKVHSEEEYSEKIKGKEHLTMEDYELDGYEIINWVGETPAFLKQNL